MSDFNEHTRMWADEIVDRCYHDSHMYVGEGLWRCDQCGEVTRYIDDPNGNITLTELHPYKNRKVRTEVVTPGNRPGNREWWTPRLPSSGRSCYVIGHNFTPQPGCSTLCVCGDWDHHPVHGQDGNRLYLDLKGALERLCRAQTHLPAHWRSDAQQAINIVQEIGSAVCPDAWSKYDQPEYPGATS